MPSFPRASAVLKRVAGPAGPWWNRAAALLLAAWITHGALRAALLFRADGFGFPLVGKADWYIFHALVLDLHWIALTALPFFAALRLAARAAPRLCGPILGSLAAFHAAVLPLTVIDHETMRFMGMHFDPGMMRTYGNAASVREIFAFLAHDASVPGLPYVLFFGSIPLAALLYVLIARAGWARRPDWSLKPVLWALAGCAFGYLYVHHLWTGGNRMRKLRPFVQTVYVSLWRAETPRLAGDARNALTENYRALWRAGSADTGWVFPFPEYPYYREPAKSPANAPPAAAGPPWNFVLILLESHRALNTGHLIPHGARHAATPFLDSLARANHYWTRMVATGIPTINALLSIHLSIPQHPTRQIASEFTALRHESFTGALGRRGYATRFFSAADPAWDNQTPWLRQWYQGFRYDRGRETDAALFADMAAWMRDSLADGRPFFVTAMTKTNHYPFNPVEGVRPVPGTALLVDRMNATMAYADSCLGAFFAAARKEPWFGRTVFVILGDHGFPLSEHGSSQIGHGLYTESIWLPLVIAGGHPALGTPRARHDPASQMDLAPTFFELAGVREPNAHMGHNLLSPAAAGRSIRFGLLREQAFVEKGPYRWHGAWGDAPREQGEELFDIVRDRLEQRNLLPDHPDLEGLRDSLAALARDLARLHVDALERDALWPRAGSGAENPGASDSLARPAPVN